MPKNDMFTTRNVAIAAGAVGALGLAWWMMAGGGKSDSQKAGETIAAAIEAKADEAEKKAVRTEAGVAPSLDSRELSAVEALFDMFDASNDGQLDLGEIKAQLGGSSKAASVMTAMESDEKFQNQSTINKAEWCAFFARSKTAAKMDTPAFKKFLEGFGFNGLKVALRL